MRAREALGDADPLREPGNELSSFLPSHPITITPQLALTAFDSNFYDDNWLPFQYLLVKASSKVSQPAPYTVIYRLPQQSSSISRIIHTDKDKENVNRMSRV
jgi:hypothetical protein